MGDKIQPTVQITEPQSPFSIRTGQSFRITAEADDYDGTVESVSFYNGSIRIGRVWEPPYSIFWQAPPGQYTITATAIDNDGLTGNSYPLQIEVLPPEPCDGMSPNGDYSYVFGGEPGARTLTFIPEVAGVGSNICILYYSIGGQEPFPGHIVTPGQPYPLNVSDGDNIVFYYTYSHPAGGERSTVNQKTAFTIGSCGVYVEPDLDNLLEIWRTANFPNTVLNDPNLEATVWGDYADPNGNGIPNLLEFFLNQDPIDPQAESSIEYFIDEDDLVYRYLRVAGTPEGMDVVEWSTDLDVWSREGIDMSILSTGGGVEEIEARLSGISLEGSLFMRLRVQR